MSRKLFAIDVDGTLLNDRLELSKKSAEILKRAQEEGHLIVLSSGRPWRSIAPFYSKISCKSPVICYNGAHAYDPSQTMKAELKITFPKDEVIAIARQSKKIVTSLMVEGEKGACLLREDPYLNKYFPYKEGPYAVGPIEENLKENTYTLLFRCHPSHAEELKTIVESHPHFKYRHWSSSFYSEAYLEGTSKGSALLFLLEHYHLGPEDVYAFGDSDNDDEMLSRAGHPFAVNACKSLLLLKKYPATEKGNNQDGVALTIEKLLF